MTNTKKTKHEHDINDVYNLLNRNYITGGQGMTRSEIEDALGRNYGDGKWYPMMKKIKQMVEENGLSIPNAGHENGYSYFITDNPNDVIPGMASDMRKVNAINSKTIRDRAFIKAREGRLDFHHNGVIYEAANVMGKLSELMEETMQVADKNLRDAMDIRLEKIKEEEVAE